MTEVLLTLPAAVVTTLFSYWPAWAVPLKVYFQSSPGSSRPFWLVSPTLKLPDQDGVGLKSSAGLPGVPLSSVTVTFLRGSLPGLVTS